MSEDQATKTVTYDFAGPVTRAFMESTAFVRGIMGPIGSGKSTACVIEILNKAARQSPSPDGIRRTRWAIIRNSYPELKTTTLKTWGDWCPLIYGKLNMDSPITHHIKTKELDIEVLFIALDREEDAKKLLSLELTGAWVNEAREIPKAIIDALTGRVGRYPNKMQGGATWSGIVMDTNPPDDQSWWYKVSEEETPKGWEFFNQPSGESPEAENVKNLPLLYYERIKQGKDPDWVKVYVDGAYGYVTEGKAVYPMFRDRVHVSPDIFAPQPDIALTVGVDFGLTPAAVIGQKLVDGRWLILDELTTDNCGIQRFAELLTKYMASNYPDHNQFLEGFGDPAGGTRNADTERTAFEIMNAHSPWKWRPAPSNDPLIRKEVVIGALNRLVDGQPGLFISPKAQMIRKGFSGGYHYRSIRSGNGMVFHDAPHKNIYSHPHDALQYLLLGGGESNVILNKTKRGERRTPRVARDVDYDVFGN